MIKYLSLFSGIGGFELGIQNSQYKNKLECIGRSEVDKFANSIYDRHFPKHKQLGDVRKIRTETLPNFDLLVGGFPCQSFSNQGLKRGFDDTRGTLFFEIARILKDKRPKYFLLENVKGLLHNNKGKTFQRILEILTNLGYDVQWQILNSKDFGVPQKRERIYLKGYSRRECRGEILSFRGNDKPINNPMTTEKENFIKIKNATKKGYLEAEEDEDGILISFPSNNTRRGRVQTKCTGTIDTNGSWGVYTNGRIRRLTPTECEALQGFPKGWTEFGVNGERISDTQRYKCVGNAVTTNVVKHIFDNWELKE